MKLQLPLMSPAKDLAVHLALWAALFVLIQLVAMAFPNPELDQAVRSSYPNQALVVMSGKSSYGGNKTSSRRSYILLPRFLGHPAFVEARTTDSVRPEISESAGSAAIAGLVFLIACGLYFGRRWRAHRNGA